ncbi:MAG: lipid A deacylase LpxR family protein [Reichenbachiella sp.]
MSISMNVIGQEVVNGNKNQITTQIDNDFFLLDLSDRYYTSGIILGYRRLIGSSSVMYNPWNFKTLNKSVLEISFKHKIFNSVDIHDDEPELIDRPYAGLMYLTISEDQYWKNNLLSIGVDMGWMGPGNRTDDIQTNAHLAIGWVVPRGWEDYQINNSPIIQIGSRYVREIVSSKQYSVSLEANGQVGSIESFFTGGASIRLGMVNRISGSVYHASRQSNSEDLRREFFVFYAPGIKTVFYNATIEGNLWGEPSQFVKEAKPIVYYHKVGVMYGHSLFDFKFYFTFLSEEVVGGQQHGYGSLSFAFRF